MKSVSVIAVATAVSLTIICGSSDVSAAKENAIVHDAEYYILKSQNGERWANEDSALDKKLAELKKIHGTPPNIVYILWDDQQ